MPFHLHHLARSHARSPGGGRAYCPVAGLAFVAVAALLVAGVSIAQEGRPDDASASASAGSAVKPTVVLLPMVVHSNERPDYLRQGLSDMLTARFTKENLLEVIPIADENKATTDIDQALEFAREAGAQYVVFGSFTRFGQGASLDVQTAALAAGPDGETLREIFVHSGSIGAVIPDLDDLVGKITRFALGEVEPSDGAPAPAATAPGPPNRSELLRRIEALEAQVQALQAAGPAN